MAPRDVVLAGVITGAHGIRGEVKLRSFTGQPEAIAGYSPLETAAGRQVEIVRLRAQKDGFIAVLKGVADRNAAEALRGTELFVPRARLPEPAAGEVYLDDLIGLAVFDGETRLGEVVGVDNFGASDLLDVAIVGQRETVYIPFAESFVKAVDAKAGRIVVALPDGYLGEDGEGGEEE
jgi:16S rRNA processing protein RimM